MPQVFAFRTRLIFNLSCIAELYLAGRRMVPHIGISQRPAECNSAIQQRTALRYHKALNTYKSLGFRASLRDAESRHA